ncbi:MAG: glycosyltransferase family 4 protein, partial [Candidatus Delongbacteria bacterium]|nr:glycosyltransferase family 4 protein [Candidatus Delongbacteria bacterium]
NNTSPKICHFTSVHPRFDSRIYYKQLKSLKKLTNDVCLVVADGKGNELTSDGIQIIDAGKPRGRINRFLAIRKKVYKKSSEINADIYQFHDPELLKYGLKLKRKGKKVIYDSHEDVPRQILNKPYLKFLPKKLISGIVENNENRIVSQLDHVFCATDHITERFLKYNQNAATIKNYPVIEDLKTEINWNEKENKVCYVGAIALTRGIREMSDAVKKSVATLELAGKFSSDSLNQEILDQAGDKIKFYGFADRPLVRKIYHISKAGLVTLHPTISYKDALPVKMFEYMEAGIPVITSNIPLWEKIITDSECGIAVDPFNSDEIASAIDKIISDDVLAEKMGRNGQKAVVEKYNWKQEEKKLLEIYEKM